MKTIVIGSGGREHAIAWALSRSPLVDEIVCIPGNGGTAFEPKCRNVAIGVAEIAAIVEACRKELEGRSDGSFIVVGPEDPLAAGLADRLSSTGLRVVGPRRAGAELEASKDFAKHFMKKYGVACAGSDTFSDPEAAIKAIKKINGPVVVKADGLAAGKGVVVAPGPEAAIQAVRDFMVDRTLGGAGGKVVVEEYLEGEEVSILAAVSVTEDLSASGKSVIVPFVSARDHKRLRDGAKGPNTGGMGAIAPAVGVDEAVLARFRSDILEPTLKGLVAERFDYRGFIFFGVMVTKNGPKLLEYNVRLGDPETQAVLPLMDFDFAGMCLSIIDGSLSSFKFAWKPGFVCAPVAVSGGYPGSYPKGLPISIDRGVVDGSGARIFMAGATVNQRQPKAGSGSAEGALVTSGGRVLASSAYGATVDEARAKAYGGLSGVSFDGMFFREDIGLPGAAVSGNLSNPA
jgi:phosphoribosylamine--glycine ligase